MIPAAGVKRGRVNIYLDDSNVVWAGEGEGSRTTRNESLAWTSAGITMASGVGVTSRQRRRLGMRPLLKGSWDLVLIATVLSNITSRVPDADHRLTPGEGETENRRDRF